MDTSNPAYRHGLSDQPEHKIWIDMRQRCENPNRGNYRHYGGRGISVCERWQVFEFFFADMGRRPSAKHSIERINNDGAYSPENCRWATPEDQRHNYRRNHWIEVNGERLTIGDWAKRLGADERTLRTRLRHGWTAERAVLEPILRDGRGGGKDRRITVSGISRSIAEWSRITGVPRNAIGKRLKAGIPAEIAVSAPSDKGRKLCA